MKVDLTKKIALVTGGGRGIGRAIVDRLLENGAIVYAGDIEFPPDKSPAAQSMHMNVTDQAQVDQIIARIISENGRLDILVNNAGINTMDHRVTLEKFPRQEWDRLLDVDLTGVYLVSRAAINAMLASNGAAGGRIINISSIVGLVPLRLQCAYAAAKAGVINLTRAMAIEFGSRGILVNCVAPGSILTTMTHKLFYGDDGMFKESVQRMLDHVPLRRPGTVDEIAHAVCFLAAPESSYINGAVLAIDGGWTAGYTREF